jgi:hypothetical protein
VQALTEALVSNDVLTQESERCFRPGGQARPDRPQLAAAARPGLAVALSPTSRDGYIRLRAAPWPGTPPLPEIIAYRARCSGDNLAAHRAGEGLPRSRRPHLIRTLRAK